MKNILSMVFVCACKFEAAIQRQNSTTSEMSTTNSKHHYNLALGQGHKVLKLMNGYNSMEVIILHRLKDATPDSGRGNCSVDFAKADWLAQH